MIVQTYSLLLEQIETMKNLHESLATLKKQLEVFCQKTTENSIDELLEQFGRLRASEINTQKKMID